MRHVEPKWEWNILVALVFQENKVKLLVIALSMLSYTEHGTIIRTGITCKKIPCYMHDSACRWFIIENAKIIRSYVKHFWIFPRERNCRILIGLCKDVLMNHPIMFLDRDNKGKLVPAPFPYFLELLWEKSKF